MRGKQHYADDADAWFPDEIIVLACIGEYSYRYPFPRKEWCKQQERMAFLEGQRTARMDPSVAYSLAMFIVREQAEVPRGNLY